MSSESKQLRKLFGSYDPFQLKSAYKGKRRSVPDWCKNKEEIRKILLRSFPKLAIESSQRQRAARWMRVIYLYFQSGYPRKEIAEEMRESVSAINTLIRSINRASKGLAANGSKSRKRALYYVNMGRTNKDPNSGTPDLPEVMRCADLSSPIVYDKETNDDFD